MGSEILLEWIPNSELFYPHNFKDISRQAKLRVQQISNFFLALRSSFSLVEYFTWPNRFAHLYHYDFCLTKMLVAFKVFYKQDLRSRTLGWLIDSAPSLLLGKNGSAKRNNWIYVAFLWGNICMHQSFNRMIFIFNIFHFHETYLVWYFDI